MSHEPDWNATAQGVLLTDVQRRGELVVAIRAYPRPGPAGRPTPPEPDAFDVELAKFVAQRLHVHPRIVDLLPDADGNFAANVPGADLVVGGLARSAGVTVPAAYTGGLGRLVVLRGSVLKSLDDLRGRRVCVASGGPYADSLAREGAVRRVYASPIRAVSAFLAGECDALAEDEVLLDRLLGLPEWRFYRRLGGILVPRGNGGQIALRAADDVSARWLDLAVRHWKIDGEFAAARNRRAVNVEFETALLLSGFVCHA